MRLRTLCARDATLSICILIFLLSTLPALAQTDEPDDRLARVVSVLNSTTEIANALAETALNADGCEDLAQQLNGWAASNVSRLEELLVLGYTLGLLPDELNNSDIQAADAAYLEALDQWSEVAILVGCESNESFQSNMSEELVMAFGYFRGGADEFTLFAEDLEAIPVFAELVECMETLKTATESVVSCREMNQSLNTWWDNFGARYTTARELAFETSFLDHDEDTSQAELQAYGGLVIRYDELIDWMDESELDCTGSPDGIELVEVMKEGLDLPPATDLWGRPEDTYGNFNGDPFRYNPYANDDDED